MISDGTWRYRLRGQNLNRMGQLGTFADAMVCHENSVVKIDPDADLRAAALISCGIATGFGAAVQRGSVRPGEVVVVAGCGGVGSGALQGARIAGARAIVAVDPLPFKQESAVKLGATHTAASLQEAAPLVAGITNGRMADVVVLTPGTLTGDLLVPACSIASKDGRIVLTALAPFQQVDVKLNLFGVAMWNQSLLGTVFGSVSPRVQIPRLLTLYSRGLLQIDELVTREYELEAVQQGYDDLHAGLNIRGVVKLGSS
jgi:S-(hydroxymethyl)glutathione dehydrogenase/alcohol dehydrogenase